MRHATDVRGGTTAKKVPTASLAAPALDLETADEPPAVVLPQIADASPLILQIIKGSELEYAALQLRRRVIALPENGGGSDD